MKKSLKIVSAILAAAICIGVGGCAKKTNYPDFYNPSGESAETSEKYVVNVLSEGGLKLSGVKVAAVKDGQTVKRGISVDGKIEFGISLGEYDLVVDAESLPAGYYLDGTTYKTSASSRESVTIRIPSKIIPQTATSSTVYTTGQIMRDFVFTDCIGQTYKLSDLFNVSHKKAVMLNFWYSACGPCGSEFPAVQKAYQSRNDIEILAICSTHQGDTNAKVQSYKADKKLTFPMGIDTIGITRNFGVQNFPTTIIIDRYGLIAYKDEGAITDESKWTALFNDFTSDNYTQKLSSSSSDGSDSSYEGERVKPTVANPSPSTLASAANGTNCSATYRFDEEDEFSWPWVAEDGYIRSTNKGVGNSYSTVYVDVPMTSGQVLSVEYNVSSEKNLDNLYVLVDGTILNPEGWSATDGWKSADLYVSNAERTVELAFIYQKDPDDPADGSIGEDTAKIRNISLRNASSITSPLDVMRPAASGLEDGATKYSSYIIPVMGDDGFYHVGTKTGPLLYITLSNLTPWSDLHTGNQVSFGSSSPYYATLYYLTYFNFAETGEETSFNVTLGTTDVTDTVVSYWTIQDFMEEPYYLLPVNDELKEWAEAFVTAFEREQFGTTAHSEEWLEFCYYYDHYGPFTTEHASKDGCRVDTDHTRGLTKWNSYTAYEKNDPELANSETKGKGAGRNKALINFPLQVQNGSYYKFTAKETGVYQIRSYTTIDGTQNGESCATVGASPDIAIFGDESTGYARLGGSGWGGVRDFDQFTGENYQGFNTYITFDANQTVYLLVMDWPNVTGYYEFEIEYKGTSLDKMFVGSTGGGAWTGDYGNIYMGVNTYYDRNTDTFYVAKNGEADYNKPIYIDFIHGSYLMSDMEESKYNFYPLSYFIENEYFDKIYMGDVIQSQMETFLAQSTEGDENSEYYGMVKANAALVENLNKFINEYVDGGRGSGNGWLMFACYMEHFGA